VRGPELLEGEDEGLEGVRHLRFLSYDLGLCRRIITYRPSTKDKGRSLDVDSVL
jgi:hypothetical protein